MSNIWLVIVSAVIGAVASLLTWWIRTELSKKDQAKYAAVRLVCIFDTFVNQCLDVVRDGEFDRVLGYDDYKHGNPDDLKFPSDLDWKTLDVLLMYGALSVENKINDINMELNWLSENASSYHDRQDREVAKDRYARLGIEVNEMASKLRKKHSIPEREYVLDSGPHNIDFLNRHLEKVRAREDSLAL